MGKLRDKFRERLIKKIEKDAKLNSNDCGGIQPPPPAPAEESAQIETPALSYNEMKEGLLEKISQMEDPALAATEMIEGALEGLAEEKTPEALIAVCLTIHHMMKFDVQFIFPAEITKEEDGSNTITFAVTEIGDGPVIAAFTSQKEYENALETQNITVSGTITHPLESLMQQVMKQEQLHGIVLNPGKDTILLNKDIIKMILSPNIEEYIKNMLQ